MAQQMTVAVSGTDPEVALRYIVPLSREEYILMAEALATDKQIGAFLRDALLTYARLHGPRSSSDVDARVLQELLLRQGVIQKVPTGESDTEADEAEGERLAQIFGEGISTSRYVIEDRDPF